MDREPRDRRTGKKRTGPSKSSNGGENGRGDEFFDRGKTGNDGIEREKQGDTLFLGGAERENKDRLGSTRPCPRTNL